MSYANAEPLLDDARVGRIGDRLRLIYPDLPVETQFVTAVVEPPYNASSGGSVYVETRWPAAQFIVLAPHPRPLQRRYGTQQASVATMYKAAWDADEKERKHFVTTDEDPAYRIFRALTVQFITNRRSLLQII